MKLCKIQPVSALERKMRAVARGERPDALRPSDGPAKATAGGHGSG